MNSRRRILSLGLLLASSAALADEGRIPIYQPTTITQPGHYVVTRDFTSNSWAIQIAASNVTVDLNGRTISTQAASLPVIELYAPATDVTILNGRISGGGYSVYYDNTGSPIRIRIRSIESAGASLGAIYLNGVQQLDIESCGITGNPYRGIWADGPGPFTGRVVGNTIGGAQAGGIRLGGLRGGEVRDNLVSAFGSSGAATSGIELPANMLAPVGGNLVEGNVIRDGGSNEEGIRIETDGNLIKGNVVSRNGYAGIDVLGANNVVEGNQIQGHTLYCGLILQSNTTVYRNNVAKGNASGICGAGIDAGGNIQ